MATGIYKLINTINNKFYIGSSRKLKNRENQHKNRIKKGIGNSIIKSAIIKYGKENFKFEVIEEFIFGEFATIKYIDEMLESREQFYVDTLCPKYNIRLKDITRNTGVCSEAQRKHLTQIAKIPRDPQMYIDSGLKRRGKFIGKNNKKSIKVDVYKRENLEFIETIKGIRECARLYNTDCSYVASFCKKGYTDQYHGEFIFCYTGTTITDLFRYSIKNRNHFLRKDNIPIVQIDKNNNFVREWRTGKEAEENLNLYKGSVSRVISGEYSHTKNYHFKLKSEYYG